MVLFPPGTQFANGKEGGFPGPVFERNRSSAVDVFVIILQILLTLQAIELVYWLFEGLSYLEPTLQPSDAAVDRPAPRPAEMPPAAALRWRRQRADASHSAPARQ
jgi:hypothetical protein